MIRRASSEDVDSLVRVYRSAYQENRELGFPAKAESVTADEIANWLDQSRLYVAERTDRVIGGVRTEATDPNRLQISRLGVHERWKGDGVGSALLDHVETVARREGFEATWLTTPEDHPYLPDLYRDRGYKRIDEYPLDYRDYDEIRMQKPLESE